jgi:hypothetical protein
LDYIWICWIIHYQFTQVPLQMSIIPNLSNITPLLNYLSQLGRVLFFLSIQISKYEEENNSSEWEKSKRGRRSLPSNFYHEVKFNSNYCDNKIKLHFGPRLNCSLGLFSPILSLNTITRFFCRALNEPLL